MKKTLLGIVLFAGSAFGQFTAYVAPGPFAICRGYDNPFLCGVWNAQGRPIQYELYISSLDAQAVGYSYTVTALLNGTVVSRSGMVPRSASDAPGIGGATVVFLNFGGVVTDIKVVAYELGAIAVTTGE